MSNDAAERAMTSLEGLSVGDAFGEQVFHQAGEARSRMLDNRTAPVRRTWQWTDDTAMAISIVGVLRRLGRIDPDALAGEFLRRYAKEPWRGYGRGAHALFGEIAAGTAWPTAAAALFGGQGSRGNGAAMRAAPVGAYFAFDLDRVVDEARASAAPTHTNVCGAAGAVAVAVTAALVVAGERDFVAIVSEVWQRTPASETRERLRRILKMRNEEALTVAAEVGNGSDVVSRDTVPFVVWCAARYVNDFEEAMWASVGVGGDTDTTCAMIGGIIVGATGLAGIPASWQQAREPLPAP